MPKKMPIETLANRVDLIAKIFLVLGLIQAVLAVLTLFDETSSNQGSQILPIALSLIIGIGLPKRSVFAYYTLRVLGWFALIGLVLVSPVLVMGLIIAPVLLSSLYGAGQILALVILFSSYATYAAIIVLWIYAMYITWDKRVKDVLFSKDANQNTPAPTTPQQQFTEEGVPVPPQPTQPQSNQPAHIESQPTAQMPTQPQGQHQAQPKPPAQHQAQTSQAPQPADTDQNQYGNTPQ